MKIEFKKMLQESRGNRESWMYSFLMHVMTEHTKDCREWKNTLNADIADEVMPLEVKVTINGVEVPFESFIDGLKEAYNKNLQETASSILQEKFSNLTETLFKAEREIEWRLQEAVSRRVGESVSTEWVLNQLAGMKFPEQGGAYDFIKKCLGR